MESETGKKQRFTKRRERAQVNQVPDYGSGDDDAPPRSFKDKPRSKPRKKKNNLSEEDIIDGFAIISFKTIEDLENCIKANTKQNEKTDTNLQKDKFKSSFKKKVKKHRPLPLPSPRLRQSEESVEPSSSGELTESHDTHKINSPRRSTDSRDLLSEGSSSSGRGYLCDSESGDERASDASSDIFSLNRNRECILPSSIPACSSAYSATVTTSSTSSNITDTLASTTATSTSPTTTTCALSTASVTVTTESTKTTCSITSPAVTTSTSVITNGPNVITPSLKRKTLSPLSRASPTVVKQTFVSKTTPITTVPLSVSTTTSIQKELRKVSPSPRVTPKREDFREKEQGSNPFAKPWGRSGTPNHLFGPQVSLSPGLSPYHSSYPQQPIHNSGLSHSMFASPLPPGPSSNPGTGAALNSPTDPMSIASQEILREELNRRFLAAQDNRSTTSSLIGPPPYMRADIHQHQHMHQHQHQHTHQHMYPIVPPFTGALVPTPAPLPVTKFGDSPFYRNMGLPPGYPGLSPLIPPSGGLSSTLSGAFQPRRVSTGLHPSQMLHSLRERDKIPTAATLPPQKKPGKWNAVHVRIAWEIYQHQQKHIELQKGQEGKTLEPLRPPSHLFPGGHRPTDLSTSSVLLSQGSHGSRGGFEQSSGPSSFLNPIHSGASPFPKPSPYSIANPLSFGGLGSGSGAFSGRDMPSVPGLTSPHEWNRLHRTPPSFPTAPNSAWNKREEGEVSERGERGLEPGVLALDRRRDEERERDRRNGEHERRMNLDDRNREREMSFIKDAHASRSRSRSRSPLQNGRVGSAKSDSSYERKFDDKGGLKIKQERREEDLLLQSERDKLRTDILLGRNPATANPLNFNILDRARLLGAPSPYMLGDRVPPHPALFSQYDKSPMEMNLGQHRLQFQQEMERERERLLNRIPHPSLFDPEQLRKEELLLQDERARRDFLERLPFYDPQRLAALEQSRYPPFRPPDPLSSHFPRTISPMIGHAKGGSPAGYPPPLIPSSSATQSRTQSPAVGRNKPSSTDTADKRETFSTDPSLHNR